MTTETKTPDSGDLNRDDYAATYCPEDNKIRLYVGRVERPTYDWLRSLGFVSTPRQSCDFVATWTPWREDAALSMIDEADDIGDEDESPEDRAADRAERFAGYRDKRRSEAHGLADTYEAGPSALGNQRAERAEKAAARRDRIGNRACSQWSKAEYWQQRTAGVISHALYSSSARVRRGRIIRLETERRKTSKASPRWLAHYDLRLAYERQMLEAQGGTAGDVDMVPGGFFGGNLILKVNKSRATGAVVSVNVHCPSREGEGWDYRRRGETMLLNVQRSGESAYSPPTEESLAQLAEIRKADKAKTKKANAGKPKLINPTPEAAAELQRVLNESRANWRSGKDAEPVEMTQAQYSARSGGTYSPYEARCIHTDHRGVFADKLRSVWGGREANTTKHFKVRMWNARVIILTDKPQKPLPLADAFEDIRARNDYSEILPRIPALMTEMKSWADRNRLSDEARKTFDRAQWHGLLSVRSLSQWSWADAVYEYMKIHAPAKGADAVVV